MCEFRRAKKVRSTVSRLEVRVIRRRRVGECESELGAEFTSFLTPRIFFLTSCQRTLRREAGPQSQQTTLMLLCHPLSSSSISPV